MSFFFCCTFLIHKIQKSISVLVSFLISSMFSFLNLRKLINIKHIIYFSLSFYSIHHHLEFFSMIVITHISFVVFWNKKIYKKINIYFFFCLNVDKLISHSQNSDGKGGRKRRLYMVIQFDFVWYNFTRLCLIRLHSYFIITS
jgi:hypothetical protein